MNKIKITLFNSLIYNGRFPTEQLKEIDQNLIISVNKTDKYFIDEITIEFETDEDPLSTAFELGRLVQTIQENNQQN